MNTLEYKKARGSLRAPAYNVALILPVEQTRSQSFPEDLMSRLASTLDELYGPNARPVTDRIQAVLSKYKRNTDKKTVAIFVAPGYEKTFYLDAELKEKIVINQPFGVRDLVNYIQPREEFLLLLQTADYFRIFLGSESELSLLKPGIPDNIFAYKNDMPERVENFSDTTGRKEVLLDKFIHHIDKELEHVRNKYPLPVFILGPERMNGHFAKLTHNGQAVAEYLHGSFDDATPHELMQMVRPHLKTLASLQNDVLKHRIEQAMNASKFSFGIDEVWRNVMQNMGNTLVVEQNYKFPQNGPDTSSELNSMSGEQPELAGDAVDMIIEKVLEAAGTVKFVEAGSLQDYLQIALFLYY